MEFRFGYLERSWFIIIVVGLMTVNSAEWFQNFFNYSIGGILLKQILAVLGAIVVFMLKMNRI